MIFRRAFLVLIATALLVPVMAVAVTLPPPLNEADAGRFANLALACVHKEYPNKIAHVMNGDADLKPPRDLTPVFYGCYDWHSAVHGHWMLARVARRFPEAPFAAKAREALDKSFTAANVAAEVRYMEGTGRATFERPYGLAWLLQLSAELHEWDDPQAQGWARNLDPLIKAAVERIRTWLPKLSHPIRTGEHNQTAFALGLLIDWARGTGNREALTLFETRARELYGKDKACPLSYEPSGEDFLSPCLAEADLMRRLLPIGEFISWLDAFLPQIGKEGWIKPAVVTDPTDGKLAHLDGLNLSRAWMLDGIIAGLPSSYPQLPALRAAAGAHREAGLASVTGEHYEGGHWLGSFATYLATGRGLPK